MKNIEWLVKEGYDMSDVVVKIEGDVRLNPYHQEKEFYINLKGKRIDTIKSSVSERYYVLKAWLNGEHIEPILNDAEREYLAAIIKPFRNDVIGIYKSNYPDPKGDGFQRIGISLMGVNEDIILPLFKAGTMYKGMESSYSYTVEELNL